MGLAVFQAFSGMRGLGCACLVSEIYSGELGAVPAGRKIFGLPPWQSVQPRAKLPDLCMVGASSEVWQLMQPSVFCLALSNGCWRKIPAGSCGRCCGGWSGADCDCDCCFPAPGDAALRARGVNRATTIRHHGDESETRQTVLRIESHGSSEGQCQRSKAGKQDLAVVKILQACAGEERSFSGGDDNVLVQLRTIPHAEAQVFADAVPDVVLEQHDLQRFGVGEAEVVEVGEAAQIRRDIEVGAGVEDVNSRIDEVRLALFLIGAQGRASRLPGVVSVTPVLSSPICCWSQKLNGPPAKLVSSTMVSKPRRGAALAGDAGVRAGIAGGVEKRGVIAGPVLVDRKLQGCQLRVDVHGSPGDGIEGVMAQRLVKSVIDVDALDVPVARPSQVIATGSGG